MKACIERNLAGIFAPGGRIAGLETAPENTPTRWNAGWETT
jgi:hypothetical protein